MADLETIYDEFPYLSYPIPATYPPQLALSSLIHGGPYPAVDHYRLLEIGCGNGANLLPLAFYSPGCEFVGIDNAATAIESGSSSAGELGLTNLRFAQADVADPRLELDGVFDFVLAHGVFSWVAEPKRRRILHICRSLLARRGLVYLSYNVEPAWKLRGLVRDLLKQAVAREGAPQSRVTHAKELAAELRDLLKGDEHPYPRLMAQELDRVVAGEDTYIFHEYLAEENTAFGVGDFVEVVGDYGLDYVCDAMFNRPEGRLPDPLVETFYRWGFRDLALEQQVDAFAYRQFRASLLCLAAEPRQAVPLQPMFESWWLASRLYPENSQPRLSPGEQEELRADDGRSVSISDPLVKALFICLRRHWPRPLAVAQALEQARSLLEEQGGKAGAGDPFTLLLDLHCQGLVELSPIAMPRHPFKEGQSPHALARFEAARGDFVTTPFHTPYPLREFEREMLRLFGEQTDPDKVIAALLEKVSTGELAVEDSASRGRARSVREAVRSSLASMRQWGLF